MKIEYRPFGEEMIPEAGRLLAERHTSDRMKLPLLPRRFEEPQVAAKTIGQLWKEKHTSGYAAFRGDRMLAYLIGTPATNSWGRAGTVHLPGYALVEEQSPAIMQDLYACLGEDWVKKGYFDHYVYVSAADQPVIDALFDIGFGKERVDALMDIRRLELPKIETPPGVTVRQAGPGDNAHLGSLSNIIFCALEQAPHWLPTVPEDWNELYEGWSELADDREWTIWLALEENQALGTVGFRPEQETDTQLLASPHTLYLSVAATQPEARGRGISTALTWHGLEQARKAGFEICYTNWISPNFLASRFWPRFGFQDVAYRLAKKVNPMIAWTREK